MIATSGFLAALECTEFGFNWGSGPDITGGAYIAPTDPLAGLRGPISKGEEEEGKGRGREREGLPSPFRKFPDRPVYGTQIWQKIWCRWQV